MGRLIDWGQKFICRAFAGLAIFIVSPVLAEQMEFISGALTNKKGVGTVKITNDTAELMDVVISVVDCETYQVVDHDLWRTNINPKQKDYDHFQLSPGNARYFGIQFKNPGCYQICLTPTEKNIYSNTCKPLIFANVSSQ